MPPAHFLRLSGRWLRVTLEVALFTTLILATRCANFRDVFVAGKVYFVDADCYARMSRVTLVLEHPGSIVRHHDFENFPDGVSPHTTAPMDYLIAALATALRPLTSQPLDVAGALVSPLLATAAGWFLWWWSRRVPRPARYAMLLLYALSAILVHGTALGRPDQQALVIALLLVAFAAEFRLQELSTRGWSIVSGLTWGLALWVSLYEPLILMAALLLSLAIWSPGQLLHRARRPGWWILLAIVLLAALLERRFPEWPGSEPLFANWARTIGELQPVGLRDPVWLYWTGGLLLVSPFLLFEATRRRTLDTTFAALLVLTFLLTLSQARWGYFFALAFLFTLPAQLTIVRQTGRVLGALALALLPLFVYWEKAFRPNEIVEERRATERSALVQSRAVAASLGKLSSGAILAPWWLSPATAYWSGLPVVAGSSHESLPGIVASARFFLSTSPGEAEQILRERRVKWVLFDDGDRVTANSAAILGVREPAGALCRSLAHPQRAAPRFLKFAGRNGACDVYEVRDLPQKSQASGQPTVDISPPGFY